MARARPSTKILRASRPFWMAMTGAKVQDVRRVKLTASHFSYPESPADRTRWILERREAKAAVDAGRAYAFLFEQERGPDGEMWPTATIFLTNKECPWRCLMCDLWKNTTDTAVDVGAIPAQIRAALAQMPKARQIKLYNSGSFFDGQAVPNEDWRAIAEIAQNFERVIVECHPALVGESVAEFAAMLGGRLEVAMGLETAHPEVLQKLNKRMTLGMFEGAAGMLRDMKVDLRVFVLVKPPFMDNEMARRWGNRSIDFAIECGAGVVSVIPTRAGNGALDELARQGEFAEPGLQLLEDMVDYGVGLARARVFADLWDLRRFSKCPKCFEARQERLHRMNCAQRLLERVNCECR
jgi:radical SAM enzyme (TIGR01210 family)